MCKSPIHIKNRSAHYNPNLPLYFTVPCGKCEECLQKARNDWFVRCYYEWQKQDISAFFYTLTYNNDYLPTISGVPCFSKRDVQLFMKRLRKVLSKFGFKCRYMFCSEFGELRKRPHYHVIFFVDNDINAFRFYKIVQECWICGFVKYGENMGLINSSAGIKYVTKYVTKDMANIDSYFPILATVVKNRYDRLMDYIRKRWSYRLPVSLHIDYLENRIYQRKWKDVDEPWFDVDMRDNDVLLAEKICNKAINMVKQRMPFHLQSTHLGFDFTKVSLHKEAVENGFTYCWSKSGIKKYSIPRYYKRMLWYDAVENEHDGKKNRFVLNDLGIKHYFDNLEKRIDDAVIKYQSITINRHHYLDDDAIDRVSKVFGKSFHVDRSSLMYWLDNFDLNYRTLAIYSTVFRDRVCPFNYSIILNDNIMNNYYRRFAEHCVYSTSQLDYGKVYETYLLNNKDIDFLLWNEHPFLKVYEMSCKVFDVLDSTLREHIEESTKNDDEKTRQLRELINNNYSLKFI